MNALRIRVEKRKGIWWLISPEGDPFVSLGVNHLQPDCWLAPYNREHMLQTYGEDLEGSSGRFNPDGRAPPLLVGDLTQRLRAMRFNTLGMHTYDVPPALFADTMYYCLAIEYVPLGSRYNFQQQRFPDIFSDDFAEGLRTHILDISRRHQHHDSLIGYLFSDIPRWYFYEGQELGKRPVHPWVEDLLALPKGSPGREQLVRLLGETAAKTREDSERALRAIVDQWYRLHHRFIKEADPDRLILGDKLHSPHQIPAWFEPILKRYVDVICIQWYTPPEDQSDVLHGLHERTGLPILNGDSSFGCAQPPHQSRVKGCPVATKAEAGKAYRHYLNTIMTWPFMLGWHHCGIVEQWDGGKQNNWELNENGFLDPFENPYPDFVTEITSANRSAAEQHARAGTTYRNKNPL